MRWTQTGRLKPCIQCGTAFWCVPSDDRDRPGKRERRFCSKPCFDASRSARLPDVFWAKVDRLEPDQCWNWKGAKFKKKNRQMGYGRHMGRGPLTYAHRAAWILTHGPIPDGLLVMHGCDNVLCCNPAHLSIGSDLDNANDARAKGRNSVGEQCNSKLKEWQAREILAARDKGDPNELAALYGITRDHVKNIWRGTYWKHLHTASPSISNYSAGGSDG